MRRRFSGRCCRSSNTTGSKTRSPTSIAATGRSPLWFGRDAARRERVLSETVAGGVTINDCLLHLAQEGQPFGGVGASGVGALSRRMGIPDLQQTEAGVPPVEPERFSAAAAALRQSDRLRPRRVEASALVRRAADRRRAPARARPAASGKGHGRRAAPPARRSAAGPPYRSTRRRPAALPSRGERLAVAPPGFRRALTLWPSSVSACAASMRTTIASHCREPPAPSQRLGAAAPRADHGPDFRLPGGLEASPSASKWASSGWGDDSSGALRAASGLAPNRCIRRCKTS